MWLPPKPSCWQSTAMMLNYGVSIIKTYPPVSPEKSKPRWQPVIPRASRAIARDKLRRFQPDVVHVHNFFPQISPSIYDACLDENVPVIQTLHNYRLICPGAMLMREGKICEQCITGTPYQAAWYGCYRGSKLGSLVVAHMVAQHRKQGTWQHKVNRFIALTNLPRVNSSRPDFLPIKSRLKPILLMIRCRKTLIPTFSLREKERLLLSQQHCSRLCIVCWPHQ